jgi:hypothetical protein
MILWPVRPHADPAATSAARSSDTQRSHRARAILQYNPLLVIVDTEAIVRAEEFRVSSRRGQPIDEHDHQRRMEFSAALSAPR